MKIHQWIDKYNTKVTYEINHNYSVAINNGKSSFFFLHFSFWGKYIFRLVLVLSSLILLKKDTYKTFLNILLKGKSLVYSPDKHSGIYIRICELFATLFGFRYFTNKNFFPLPATSEILASKLELPAHSNPLVSIIIGIDERLDYTYNCLRSIQNNVSSAYPYEIIIIDNCLQKENALIFQNNIVGVTYLQRNSSNASISNLTLGVKHSKGRLICLLNNQVQVSKNWLETLINTMKNEDVGCVGSKIIGRNGLLEQAGGIFYEDFTIANYGSHQNPEHPHYNYIRETDFCTIKSLIFRKAEISEIEFFEGNFNSSLYQSINLCFTIRHILQKKVIYQPLSNLTYFGKINEDHADLSARSEKMIFTEKWVNIILSYHRTGNINTDARKYQTNKTILFIDDIIPTPDQDSGSNRLFRIMKILKSLGYHIIFAPNDGRKRDHYLDQMILEGFEVLYRFPNRKGMINILIETLPYVDIAWLCKPHNNELFKFIFKLNTDCLWIYDTIDLHFLRLQREGELTKNDSLLQSAKRVRETEISIAKQADITIAITNDEKLLLNEEHIDKVVVIPNIHDIKNNTPSLANKFENRTGILFIGGYIHKPNVDAAEWLVKEIMPTVWAVNPSIKLTLLGSNPTPEILAYQSELINVPGYIHDVSKYFNENRIFVAPLRFGAGMKGKIGQSLEYGLPIVSTGIGIEGMNLIDEKNVLIAENAADFATQILRLYQAPDLWQHIKNNSIEAIEEFTPKKVALKLKDLIESLHRLN